MYFPAYPAEKLNIEVAIMGTADQEYRHGDLNMNSKQKLSISLLLIILILSSPLIAEEQETNPPVNQAINICALAIPIMNLYVLSYEYLLADYHGIALRAEIIPLKDSDTGIDGLGSAAVINYRWHPFSRIDSFFVGPYARYRYVTGSGNISGTSFDYSIPEFTLGINAGYRWIFGSSGFNVVMAAGYGYSWREENFSTNTSAIQTAFREFKGANAGTTNFVDAPFYGEFSLGYAF